MCIFIDMLCSFDVLIDSYSLSFGNMNAYWYSIECQFHCLREQMIVWFRRGKISEMVHVHVIAAVKTLGSYQKFCCFSNMMTFPYRSTVVLYMKSSANVKQGTIHCYETLIATKIWIKGNKFNGELTKWFNNYSKLIIVIQSNVIVSHNFSKVLT